MLASKAPYSASLGMQNSQSSGTAYHSSQPPKAHGVSKSVDGVAFTSPTESEFSDAHDGLDSVR